MKRIGSLERKREEQIRNEAEENKLSNVYNVWDADAKSWVFTS